jgi:hypothetical protein
VEKADDGVRFHVSLARKYCSACVVYTGLMFKKDLSLEMNFYPKRFPHERSLGK